MHPALVEFIVKLFNDKSINKANSQLIFITHATNLLTIELLRRDQIWFTEKIQILVFQNYIHLIRFQLEKMKIFRKVT